MYHGVGQRPAPHSEPRYTIARPRFEEQLDLLRRGPAHVMSLDQCLSAADRGGRTGVVLTFDDGEASVAGEALPAMACRGMAGTVYVTTAWIGQPGYLTRSELRALAAAGWTVGAHGVTHRYLSGLDDADLDEELLGSKQALEELLGRPVHHMSLPGGRADARVAAAVRRAGYMTLATSRPGRWGSDAQDHEIPRLTILTGIQQKTFRRIVEGHLSTYLKIMGRSVALDGAKYVLGDRRYDRLRAGVLRRVGRPRSS